MANWSARFLTTSLLQNGINQVAHNFKVGNIVVFNGATWVKARANLPANCQGIVIVSNVIDADNFVISQVGLIRGMTDAAIGYPFTPGTQYYLSEILADAGKLTSVKPTGVGEVVIPCFVAETASSGYFIGNDGVEITSPSQLPFITVNANTAMTINTGYYVDSAVNVDMTMPVSMGTNDRIIIRAINTGGFTIKHAGAQTIKFLNSDTTPGTGTIVTAATMGVLCGTIDIGCYVTDTNFIVTNSTGNYTVT